MARTVNELNELIKVIQLLSLILLPTNYNNEEIVLFLKRKLLEYKRKMFNISECVVKQLKK